MVSRPTFDPSAIPRKRLRQFLFCSSSSLGSKKFIEFGHRLCTKVTALKDSDLFFCWLAFCNRHNEKHRRDCEPIRPLYFVRVWDILYNKNIKVMYNIEKLHTTRIRNNNKKKENERKIESENYFYPRR